MSEAIADHSTQRNIFLVQCSDGAPRPFHGKVHNKYGLVEGRAFADRCQPYGTELPGEHPGTVPRKQRKEWVYVVNLETNIAFAAFSNEEEAVLACTKAITDDHIWFRLHDVGFFQNGECDEVGNAVWRYGPEFAQMM